MLGKRRIALSDERGEFVGSDRVGFVNVAGHGVTIANRECP
jgi:hypothetical protein